MKHKISTIILFFIMLCSISAHAEYPTITPTGERSTYKQVSTSTKIKVQSIFDEVTIPVGNTVTIEIPLDKDAEFTMGDTVEVDSKYLAMIADGGRYVTVTAINPGRSSIVFYQYYYTNADKTKYEKIKFIVPIVCSQSLEITLSNYTKHINIGRSEALQAKIYPSELYTQQFRWTNSNPDVATISFRGVQGDLFQGIETLYSYPHEGAIMIKGLAVGTSIITCETIDGSVKAVCTVTITDPNTAVTGLSFWGVDTVSLGLNDTYKLHAYITPLNASNKNITWHSSDTSVVIVSDGTLIPRSKGTATVTATTDDGGYTASCTVKVGIVSVSSISLNTEKLDLTIGDQSKLTATILPYNADNRNIIWSSSDSDVASVLEGWVTANGCGTAVITAKTKDGGKIASCEVKVIEDTIFTYESENKNMINITGLKDGITVKELTIPSTINGVQVSSIAYAFQNRNDIEKVFIPAGVGFTGAFAYCENLTNVILEDGMTGVSPEAFYGCTKLAELKIPDSVWSLGRGCISKTAIKSLKLPKSYGVLEDYTPGLDFDECPNLEEFIDNNFECDFSVDEEGVLYNKDKTILLSYPQGKKDESYIIPDSVTTIGHAAFGFRSSDDETYVHSLKNLTIPKSVKTIEFVAFKADYLNLEKIYYMGSKFEYNNINVDTQNNMLDEVEVICTEPFYWNINENGVLTVMCDGNMPDYSVTSEVPWYSKRLEINEIVLSGDITSIGDKAFYSCVNANKIDIPESIISISSTAFENCDELTIHSTSEAYAKEFAQENNINYVCTNPIVLPELNTEFYQSSSKWYFDVTINDYSGNAKVYLALYNEKDKLISVTSKDLVIGDVTTVSDEINAYASYAKIFAWDSLNTLKPVSKSYMYKFK